MLSQIPVKPLPVDPNSDTYQIALPTRFTDDGNVVALTYPKSLPLEKALEDIHANNPRDSADTQVQYMLDPEYRNNMPFEDFKAWKKEKQAIQGTSVNVNYMDLAVDAVKDIAKGAVKTGESLFSTDPDARKVARARWNAIEGGLQGTERLGQLAQMADDYINKGITKYILNDTDKTDEIEYKFFQQENKLLDTMKRRASGELITQQGTTVGEILSPLLGPGQTPEQDSILAQRVLKAPANVPAATEQDIADINSISNFLDASLIVPNVAILEKLGAKMAANSILKYGVPKVLAGEVLPKLAFGAAEYTGKALETGTKLVINTIDGVLSSVAENAETKGAQVIAGRAAAFALDIYHTGGALVGAGLAGKGLRAAGEVGGAIAEAMAKGQPVRGALRELAETTVSDVVRTGARGALRIAPPEAVFDSLKHIAGAAFDTGLFMGGIGAMRAGAAQDDPIHGFMEGFVSGASVGAVFGMPGVPGAIKGEKIRRLSEYFDNDIRSRQPEAGINVNGQQVKVNDVNGRVALFNREDLTPEQKGFIISLTQAHEKAGNRVIFHDGSPEVVSQLQAAGLDAGEGVQFFGGPEGRSFVLLDSSKLSPGTAVEEIFHGMVSDSIIKEVARNIDMEIRGVDPQQQATVSNDATFAPRRTGKSPTRAKEMLSDLQMFADRYIDLLERTGTESGKAKAAEFRSMINRVALDPNMMPDIKADILAPILNEYAANYARAKLAGLNPKNLMEGNIKNLWDSLWDKTMGNLLSSFDASKIGAMRDPITGHFFNEKGKRVINPTLERMVDRYLEAASEGRKEIPAENAADGTYYFDVRSEKPFVSYEDMVDGKQTTKSEKEKILNEAFKSNAAFLNSISPVDHVVLVTERLQYEGAFHGNISKMKPGKDQLIFSQSIPEAFFDHLERTGQITPEQARVNKLINREQQGGKIVMLDAWADIGRHKGDRDQVYYGRGNRAFLPISIQQAPKGGVTWAGLDVTRVWDYAKRASKKIRAVKEEFNAKGIDSMQEFLPYLQRYFDNYSSDNPIPAAELKDFSPTMRDVISTALNIENRGTKFFAEDANKFANIHTFNTNMVGSSGASVVTMYRRGKITHAEMNRGLEGKGVRQRVVPLGGTEAQAVKAVKMARQSVSLMQIRADRVLGVSDFSINNAPVAIRYNPYKVTNLVRANFSPGRTTVEKLGDSEVHTDMVNGKRIIVKPDGKAILFDGDRKSIHGNLEEAETTANQRTSKEDAEFNERVITNVEELKFSNIAGRSAIVPDQRQLDAMKEKLPAHFSAINASEGKFGTTYKIDLFNSESNQVGHAYVSTDVDAPNTLAVEAAFVNSTERKKGYGQALYREIAKIAQNLGVTKLTSTSTGVEAARARSSILETNWKGDGLPAESNVPSDVSFAPRRKKEAIESTDNAFADPVNSSRSLADKAVRNYFNKNISLDEMYAVLDKLNQSDKSNTEARKEAAELVAAALREQAPPLPERKKAVEVELPAEESNVTYEGMTRDEAVTLKLLNKNGTVSLSKIRKYHAEKARAQKELNRIQKEKQAELDALEKQEAERADRIASMLKEERATELKEGEERTMEAESIMEKYRKSATKERAALMQQLLKERDIARDNPIQRGGEYDRISSRIAKMIRDENERVYLKREKKQAKADKLMEKYRAQARKERAKMMQNLLKEQDQSYEDYVKDFFVQEAKAEKEAATGSAERRKAGEEAEAMARRSRTVERGIAMEGLLKEQDVQAAKRIQDLAEQRKAQEAAQPKVVEMEGISDPRIPAGARIVFTPQRKYRVFYTGAGVVGITDDFESAIKLSNKYAARKVNIR